MRVTDGRKILPALPEWEYATWRGAAYLALEKSAAMTFRERLEWLENAAELAERIGSAVRKPLSGSGSVHK